MAIIKNSYMGPLFVGSVEIPAGKTADVPEWGEIKGKGIYPTWIEAGVIEVEGPVDPEKPVETKPDEKDQLIADLEALGIKADRRKSVETLQAELEAATNPAE